MKTYDSPDCVVYKLNCNCDSNDHLTSIEIERDDDLHDLTIHFYKKMIWTSQWGEIAWYQRIWKRLICSIKMLFTGWIEVEEYVIIYGEDHINSLIEALEEGKQQIKKSLENENTTKISSKTSM